jgi:hypothetical protein
MACGYEECEAGLAEGIFERPSDHFGPLQMGPNKSFRYSSLRNSQCPKILDSQHFAGVSSYRVIKYWGATQAMMLVQIGTEAALRLVASGGWIDL